MKNPDSDFIYYAKGWYDGKNRIQDLKKILSKWSGVPVKLCSKIQVVNVLLDITISYLDKEELKDFIKGLAYWAHPRCAFYAFAILSNKKYNYENRIIDKCLSTLACLKVKDNDKVLIPMDEPDYILFPKKVYSS